MQSEKQLESRTVYDGKVVRLQVDRVMLPDGKETTREVVRHRGAVAISAVGDTCWNCRPASLRQARNP